MIVVYVYSLIVSGMLLYFVIINDESLKIKIHKEFKSKLMKNTIYWGLGIPFVNILCVLFYHIQKIRNNPHNLLKII